MDGEVEFDELMSQQGTRASRSCKKGRKGTPPPTEGPSGGTAQDDKVPVLGMIQRGGSVIIRALDNVQRKTIEPIIRQKVRQGAKVFTDEYNIYGWLPSFYEHKTVNHGQGEYAGTRTATASAKSTSTPWKAFGHCSLVPWLRPHRGILARAPALLLGIL
ncbi:MAG: transposase [Saprospiraceae bacterium]|nr:transposase [Saprospiraceae bacterium]